MSATQWFEIPVTDLDRAARFYERVLGTTMHRETFGTMPMALFAFDPPGAGGALVVDGRRKPARDGTLVYLATSTLDAALERVKAAGGDVVLPSTDIGEHGRIALLADTEGNVVGLHQPRC